MFKASQKFIIAAMLVLPSIQTSFAENVINVKLREYRKPTVAIVPFRNDSGISSIISKDLNLSGKVSLDVGLPEEPHYAKDINIKKWKNLGVPYIVVGRVIQAGKAVEFNLIDTFGAKSMLRGPQRYTVPRGNLPQTAHVISDVIYEAITGKKSDFSGKLAYIHETNRGNQKAYEIRVSNTDGSNSNVVFTTKEPILSLNWSPNGKQLAYVSYENSKPEIFIQNIYGGGRTLAVGSKGTNSSPSFSPDGTKLLFTSSQKGNFDIYIKNLNRGSVQQLTTNRNFDTDPSFAPDGKSFVFTSDRSGSPQVYQYDLLTGSQKRLTLVGNYNTRPKFNKDGTKISLIHNYRAAVMDIKSGVITTIGSSPDDESPGFAPNSDIIVYSTKAGGKQTIKMVSTNGQQQKVLPSIGGNMRDPVWAPKQ